MSVAEVLHRGRVMAVDLELRGELEMRVPARLVLVARH
jgi:hypothetical protein